MGRILVSNRINAFVMGYKPINERVIMLKIRAKPSIINIVSLYAPIANAEEEIIEQFYRSVEEAINRIPNK